MKWINACKKSPRLLQEVLISYIYGGISTKQYQTYAQVVGRDRDEDLIWKDFMTGNFIDKHKIIVTHWMMKPDNPILIEKEY